jgi:beta-N-acetylhexosaminidase
MFHKRMTALPLLLFLSAARLFSLHFNDPGDPDILARQIVDGMTDEELAGQVLMFGYQETDSNSETLEWIARRGLGSIKVFGWNGKDITKLARTVGAFQTTAGKSRFGIPLFIATDQEGGIVRHITDRTSQTPGSMSLGASPLLYDTWMTAWYIGLELRALGVNMNFAPVIDIYNNPDGSYIHTRCFSDNPVGTGISGLAFCRGQEAAGVISTAKHYPGHGNTSVNSHGKLPVIDVTLEEFRSIELVPYKILVRENVPAIMVGHISFPRITGSDIPSSLSSFFITTILKEELGFKGVVITDDMTMYGVRAAGGGIPALCVKSIRAGADIVLISRGDEAMKGVWDMVLKTMKIDPDFRARVKDAAFRVVRIKLLYLRGDKAVPLIPDPDMAGTSIPADGSGPFFFDQAARSITVIRKGRIPLTPQNAGKVLILSSYKQFLEEGVRRFPGAETYLFAWEPFKEEQSAAISWLAPRAGRYDTIIFCLSSEKDVPILQSLKSWGSQVVVISVFSPLSLKRVPWTETAIAAYSTLKNCLTAGFAVLCGDYEPEGKIPINLDP